MMKCPVMQHTQQMRAATANWWPKQLNLKPLVKGDPTTEKSYAEEFNTLDIDAVKADVMKVMKTSQNWWPADYGHYGPFFIRLAWHSAGTYRTFDGRGGGGTGNMRFAPLNSWPDNVSLDKARRLLWPIKQKYGRKISYGDLMIFAGNCAIEDMGLKPFGFGGGRVDIWEPEEDIYWGLEREWLAAERGELGDDLHKPLGATQMGLIYVNPEGPGGNPDPLLAAKDIRTTFGRMAMNDEETVALIAGGHTFGKAHGAADPGQYVGPEPEGGSIQNQGLGWTSSYDSGKGVHAISSGLEGAWTAKPTQWDNGYFENLFKYEWEQTKSPAGATQWIPTDKSAAAMVPDAHDASKRHAPIMFTTDLAMRFDPIYGPISKRFYENPDQLSDAFARAWYKLTHRDMGPRKRLLGKYVAAEQLWQDPVPDPSHPLIGAAEIAELKGSIMKSGLSIGQLVRTAWASASTFRCTDYRGGSNGSRIRLAPQKDWAANDPADLAQVLQALGKIKANYGKPVSLADLIVLGGCAAVESAAKAAGEDVTVPFHPGRADALQEQTDVESFAVLEPTSDGFRNYQSTEGLIASPEALLVDKAHMMSLTKAEMTVLVGGMRMLNANAANSQLGVFTAKPGALSNDFFVNLLDMSTKWSPAEGSDNVFEGRDRSTGSLKWKGSRVDLIFGSNSQLRAIAEYYACDDSKRAFVNDFVSAFAKVMTLDRFE